MADLIQRIIDNEDSTYIISEIINKLHKKGPVDPSDLEVLSYIKEYQRDFFRDYESTIINLMGLYFKSGLSEDQDIRGVVSSIYGRAIEQKYNRTYTPVQANLVEGLAANHFFSFSSATSTGKSHVFRDLILNQQNDMVIVVPSRALINEYFTKTVGILENRKVNVLVFPDIVNTDMAERTVYILTPERVKDLFKIGEDLKLETVLFDEAQIADEPGRRGIYFDSIVRRINENFPQIKMLFAHPYIENPGAQFTRNKLLADDATSDSVAYPYRNVGQFFACVDEQGRYYHFAIDKNRLGARKVLLAHDPIKECLDRGGSVLVYVSKASIYSGNALEEMSKYIDRLPEIQNANALKIIKKIGDLIGGSADEESDSYSKLLALLHKGIVVHHGSLPLQVRFLIEQFINGGSCRVCFATSTLYQGVNMPFDIVYLKRLEASKSLLVKNLIGRAGRSTTRPIFDYGQVVVSVSGMSMLRRILSKADSLSSVSKIDVDLPEDNADLREFKQAIRNQDINDAYNLSTVQIERLSSDDSMANVSTLLDILMPNNSSIGNVYKDLDSLTRIRVGYAFKQIYRAHVQGRELSNGEAAVIENAVRIFMLQISGRSLRSIIETRFALTARLKERRKIEDEHADDTTSYLEAINKLSPLFLMPAEDLPNESLQKYGLLSADTKVYQVNYDLIVYDTYDYIDKVWGFSLSDVFYAAFDLYYSKTLDSRAEVMCKYVRYATIDEVEIWLLRYGFSPEEIEWIKPLVLSVDERRIEFGDISNLSDDEKSVISRYLPDTDDSPGRAVSDL